MTRFQTLPALVALACIGVLGTAADAGSDCPDHATVRAMADDMLAARPTTAPEVATMEGALCAQALLVEMLAAEWGAPVGHKAGLTGPNAQAAFGVSEPVRGVLFAGMFVAPGITLPAGFGARPLYEADFVVRVGDAAINEATTTMEVLGHLSGLYPFIELPDLMVADPSALTGPKITAINVGARLGMLGAPIPAEPTQAMHDALAEMTVSVRTHEGEVLAEVPGTAILGHPLNAVLWLTGNGVTLAEGDLISLGSFGPLFPPQPGLTATIRWEGLPGDPELSVTFE